MGHEEILTRLMRCARSAIRRHQKWRAAVRQLAVHDLSVRVRGRLPLSVWIWVELEVGSEALLVERHRLSAVAVEMDKGCDVFHDLLFHRLMVAFRVTPLEWSVPTCVALLGRGLGASQPSLRLEAAADSPTKISASFRCCA